LKARPFDRCKHSSCKSDLNPSRHPFDPRHI
jgi:hypothetical protein